MATTISTNGTQTTVTITYTAQTAKVTDTLTAAAQYWHKVSDNPTPFDSLTNAQKLAVLDAYVLQTVREAAARWHVISAREAAEITAQSEVPNKFI